MQRHESADLLIHEKSGNYLTMRKAMVKLFKDGRRERASQKIKTIGFTRQLVNIFLILSWTVPTQCRVVRSARGKTCPLHSSVMQDRQRNVVTRIQRDLLRMSPISTNLAHVN